jgi:uncharacterized membrane protein YbhN (UPF0104 family)
VIKLIKSYLRWLILGAILFFLLTTLKNHADEVASLQITSGGWGYLGLSLLVTMLAHIWSGWVWTWILREFNQPVPIFWALRIYLTTNMAKYIPGNVWHFYGRIVTLMKMDVSGNVAAVTVLLEPLLMAAAALIFTLIGSFGLLQTPLANGLTIGTYNFSYTFIQIGKGLGLVGVLLGVHPMILNPLIKFLGKGKFKKKKKLPDSLGETHSPPLNLKPGKLHRYPWLPLVGEMGFLALRGSGFLLVMLAMMSPLYSLNLSSVFSALLALGAFSFAWLLGLVVPGAPGGIGVFEATAIALLQHHFTPGVLIGSIAFYRLISVLAEAIAGAIAWLIQKHLITDSNPGKVEKN